MSSEDRRTDRLELIAIGPEHGDEIWRLHQDPWVASWYAGAWTEDGAASFAAACGRAWAADGVSKWLAYEKATGDLVGRGGLSRVAANAAATVRIDRLLCDPEWRANRLEVGWAVVGAHRGLGMATEIGRAALAMARNELGASRIISFTERHNIASRGVMDKLGMAFLGDIETRGLLEGQPGEADDAPFAVYAT